MRDNKHPTLQHGHVIDMKPSLGQVEWVTRSLPTLGGFCWPGLLGPVSHALNPGPGSGPSPTGCRVCTSFPSCQNPACVVFPKLRPVATRPRATSIPGSSKESLRQSNVAQAAAGRDLILDIVDSGRLADEIVPWTAMTGRPRRLLQIDRAKLTRELRG